MTIGGATTKSSVSGTTQKKHVVALAAQPAEAEAGYGPRTFVTDDKQLTDAVDKNGHDFAPTPGRSARKDVTAKVAIQQFDKTEDPPAGFAKGKPVKKSIDGVEADCEIGAVKTGDGAVSITHFKKI